MSRHDFECLNAQIEGTDLRQTNRWSQFVALLTSQILGLNSLREIESALNDMRAKLYHVGAKPVARTTLARVNEKEDYRLFQNLFTLLSQKLMRFSPDSKLKRQGVGKLLLMDATVISLCLSVYPRAGFRKNKDGIKLHVGVNADDDTMVMPVFCDLTTGDVHEIKHAREKDYPECGSNSNLDCSVSISSIDLHKIEIKD